MKLKRTLALILALSMLLSLAACAKNPGSAQAPQETTQPAEAPKTDSR